ncbi:kinase-like protein [Rhizoclosmatium globosum]|uniref:Kinase-like protein n=1 Tax=Rhizoclosmatium globosum TaxID=329046 RepID=A0A1Y2BP09_9FUNG|nr:kinase-like protein [Rhizoclosmatium globosum]|eukprot:ORY36484.1 kinase-like protein [Rhizoclosmatium globosum]
MERNTSSPPQGRRPFAQGIPIAEYDRAITGSTDLSGEKKERIEHHRVEDVTDLEKKYRIGRKLGQLSVLTGHCFACKSLKKKAGSPKVYEQLQREVAIMKLVRHRNIIKLHEVYETPKKIFLVMEQFCGFWSFGRKTNAMLSAVELANWTKDSADVQKMTFDQSFGNWLMPWHRSSRHKPANILLSSSDPFDKWNIKVSDFGLATWNNQCTMMENVVGTPLYMAPEILQNLPYSAQCDIWSIGVLTYILLCGFTKEIQGAFQKMVMDGKITYPHEYWKSIAPGAKNLCEGMLRTDPAKRISAKEIISHPWIRYCAPSDLCTQYELELLIQCQPSRGNLSLAQVETAKLPLLEQCLLKYQYLL